METLVKASRRKGSRGAPGKQIKRVSEKLELHQPTGHVSLPQGEETSTPISKEPERIAADLFKPHEQMLMIQPLASPKFPVPEAERYNIKYKNGTAEFINNSSMSVSNLVNEPVSNVPGLSKTPHAFKQAEVPEAGKPSPGCNSRHASPFRRFNGTDKACKPAPPASGSPVIRLQKELEPVKRLSKLDRIRKLSAKRTPVNDLEGAYQANFSPVDSNLRIALEPSPQGRGPDGAAGPARVPGKENGAHGNANAPPEEPPGGAGGEAVWQPRRPAPRLKVRANNASGGAGLAKKSPRPSSTECGERNPPRPSRARRTPLANVAPRGGGSGGKEDPSRSPRGGGRNRGGVLPRLAVADRQRGSPGSDRGRSPRLSVVELSARPHGGVDGREVSKERARSPGEGAAPRGPPSSTNTKLERLQQQLQSQDAQMRQLRRKERSWEEQVKQLKVELRNAREKERALCKIVGIDPKLPRRAETAPEPPLDPKEKPHNDAGLAQRPLDLRRSPPAEGARPRVCDRKPDFLKAHIFSRQTFRAITAPELPELRSQKNDSFLRTMIRPLQNTLVPPSPAQGDGDGDEDLAREGVESLKLASLNTQQTALCLAHETDAEVTPVGIHFGHLMQFVDAQIITQRQAEGLWDFLCARKNAVYEEAGTEEICVSEVDAIGEPTSGKATRGAVIPFYNGTPNLAQSRSPLREYGAEHVESVQQVPVLTKALRRKIEDSHLKNAHPKMSPLRIKREETNFDDVPLHGSSELVAASNFSLVSTSNAVHPECCSDELEKATDVIHLPQFQTSLGETVGYT